MFKILAENFFFLDEQTFIAPCFAADWGTVVRLCAKKKFLDFNPKESFLHEKKTITPCQKKNNLKIETHKSWKRL